MSINNLLQKTKSRMRKTEGGPVVWLAALAERKAGFSQRVAEEDKGNSSGIQFLPPFESQIAVLSAHRNKWKFLAQMATGMCALSIIGSTVLLKDKLFEKMNSEFLIVPGAAEYARVRPNLIPDSVVFDFMDFVASYAGTFTYRNARSHFEYIGERMTPELKGRFLRDTSARLQEWEKRRVDQVFAFDPARKFDLVNDKFGPKYVGVISGVRTQYADGVLLQTTEENIYLELRPRISVSAGNRTQESLLLIERLEWVSRSQAESLLATRVKSPDSTSSGGGAQ